MFIIIIIMSSFQSIQSVLYNPPPLRHVVPPRLLAYPHSLLPRPIKPPAIHHGFQPPFDLSSPPHPSHSSISSISHYYLLPATCYSNSMSHPLPLPPQSQSHSHSHSHSGTDRPSIEAQLQLQAQAQAPPPPHLSSIPSSCVSTRVSTRTYRARSRRVVKPSQTHHFLNTMFQP